MELRTTREMRRNERLDRMLGKRTEADGAPAKVPEKPAQSQAPADKLTLSQQALAWVDEQNQKMWDAAQPRESKQHDRISDMLSAMETKKQELDGLSDNLDIMNKCLKIAAAVMRGDNVPPQDLRYLMEHDKEGYKLAMALRKPKEDPKDVKSVLDDEDVNGSSQESGGGETASVSAVEASSGGGGTSAASE